MVSNLKKHWEKAQRGFSLIEVMVASAILAVSIAGSTALQSSLMQTTRRSNEAAFATEKVLQMFNEMRSHTEGSQEDIETSLIGFSDGADYNLILTTTLDTATPADPLSQNPRFGNHWKYTRQVQIEPIENDEYARRVSVTIWHANEAGQPVNPDKPLAAISGILKTNIPRTPPTQTYDFYVIAIGNAPSWWSNLYDFRPAYDAVFSDLEFRNPGLNLRKRFISNMGFGRDPFYLPHTNTESTTASSSTRLPWSYFYPGKVEVLNIDGNPIKEDFAFEHMTARLRGDVSGKQFRLQDKGDVNKFRPYAMSDEFNHVRRWPEQLAMEKRLRNFAESITNADVLLNPNLRRLKDSLKQPSLTSFLQGMNEGKFKNSMVSNMHAELTPIPPTRNYSDPAKMPFDEHQGDPTSANPSLHNISAKFLMNKRVVTHPERLFYENGEMSTDPDEIPTWRVHAYEMPHYGRELDEAPDGSTYSTDELIAKTIPHISLFLPTHGPQENMPYPNVGSSSLSSVVSNLDDVLRLKKVIGNSRLQYQYREFEGQIPVTDIPTRRSRYLTLTDVDILYGTPPPLYATNQVQVVGELRTDRTTAHNTIQINTGTSVNTVADPPFNFDLSDYYQNLIGDAIIINGSQPTFSASDIPANREVAIVVNATRSGSTVTLTLDRNLNQNHSAGEIITRHKDFSIATEAPDLDGSTREGLLIHLYNTPTRHPRHAASNTGLEKDRRLYGLEYIPAPVNRNATLNDISDDFRTDLTDNRSNNSVYASGSESGPRSDTDTSNNRYRAKNTARWTVGLALNDSIFGSEFNSQTVSLETRMIGGQNFIGNSTRLLSLEGDSDTYMTDGISVSGETHTGAANDILRNNLYNVSRTYVYTGTSFESAVPFIEQGQYIGDPRHMPYADVKARHGYNRAYFRTNQDRTSFANSGYDAGSDDFNDFDNSRHGGYSGYDQHTGVYVHSHAYPDQRGIVDIDVARAFGMYNNGIMTSNSIYNTIAGYTNYVVSLGGGIGQRGDHTYRYDLKQGPWVTSNPNNNTNNTEGNETVSERGNGGHVRFLSATAGSPRWAALPHLGEMFPDEIYGFWKENGNLPNLAFSSSDSLGGVIGNINGFNARFFRERASNTKYGLHRRNVLTMEGAVSDFYNGSSNPGNSGHRIKHSTTGGRGCLQSGPNQAGRFLSDAFNMSLPEMIESTRSFCISSGNCSSPEGANTDAYTTSEQTSRRNTIKYINLTGEQAGDAVNNPSPENSFYRFHANTTNCNGSPNNNVASGLIRLTREDVSSTPPVVEDEDLVGYAVINGLEQGQLFGAQSLSRLAQAATLQGFLEGGDKEAPGQKNGRMVPLPRLEVTTPEPTLIHGGGPLGVEFNVKWTRWDERKYTPSYDDDWYDVTPLNFNATYSTDNGRNWFYVNTNEPVPAEEIGTYNPDQNIISGGPFSMTGPQQNWSFSWNMTGFEDGNYLLKVEAYREGYDIGYSYHQVFITQDSD